MTVSVLVPVYGVEPYIERCVRSLMEQTYEKISYVFIDDCTPDKSVDIIKRVVNDYPHRKNDVRIVKHNINKGLAEARNTAVECCNTDYLFHVDSDDYLDKNVIAECVQNVLETDSDIVTIAFNRIKNGKSNFVFEDWNDDCYEMVNRIIRHQVGNGVCGRLIKTSLYKDNNIKVEVGRGMSEDLQVTPRLFYYAKKTTFLKTCFYNYYLDNENSYTGSFDINKHKDAQKALDILESFFSDKGQCFLDSIVNRRYRSIARDIISCSLSKAEISSFHYLKNELNSLPNLSEVLDLPTRIAIRISDYRLLSFYTRSASFIKRAIRYIKIN